jgi:hypothetical protein
MHDLREVFEMVTKQTEPDLDSWKQQEDRQRRSARIRRLTVLALVAAFALAFGVFAWTARPGSGGTSVTKPPSGTTLPSARDARGAIIAGLDGTIQRTVPGLPEDAFALSLAPNGTIAFVTGVDGVNTIATIGIDGQGMRTLVAGEAPAISPDGAQIAFVRNDDIYVMNVDGTNIRQLTTDPHRDEFPQWSPDGTTIVYDNVGTVSPNASGFSDTSVIMTVQVEGGAATVTQVSGRKQSSEPAYSPDGRQIVFRSHASIWIMNANGTSAHHVAGDGQGSTDAPRWSPDGSLIAYTDYSPAYRPYVQLGVNPGSMPIEFVRIVNVETGTVTKLNPLGMATFLNTPQWVSNKALLLNVSPRP